MVLTSVHVQYAKIQDNEIQKDEHLLLTDLSPLFTQQYMNLRLCKPT